MRMARVPRLDEHPREERPARVPRPPKPSIPHSANEEYLAYGNFAFILAGLITACVSLNTVSWKVSSGSRDAFGVKIVHMDGETHNLETMGCVWSVYTASRSGMGFTILGVLISAWAMWKVYKFCRDSMETIMYVQRVSFTCSIFYLFAIMLYGSLFPKHPFHGDLYYYTLGSNFTQWQDATTPGGMRPILQGFDFETLQQPHQTADFAWGVQDTAFRIPGMPLFHSIPAAPKPHSSFEVSKELHPSPFGSNIPLTSGASSPGHHSLSFATKKDEFNLDTDQGKQLYYAKIAYEHLNTSWKFGTAYWLVVASALLTLWWPFCYLTYLLFEWLYEQHKSREIQQKWVLGPLALLGVAWLLAIIALGSRFWKTAPGQGSQDHFGLDQLILGGSRLPVSTYDFSEKGGRIKDASATALAFGILGVLNGFATCVVLIFHIYDASRDWTLFGVLSTLTSLLWALGLLVYGAVFPRYLESMYLEFGYSFWLLTCSALLFFLPCVLFVGWRFYERAKETTHEERLMAIPTSLALLALLLNLAAMGTDFWAASTQGGQGLENHLGLLRGRYDGNWQTFSGLKAQNRRIATAGVATVVLELCAFLLQIPIVGLAIAFVLGRHDVCAKQMPLLNTAFAASASLLQLIGIIAYSQLMPFGDLPAGYNLSHSWRTEIVSCIFTAASVVGFAWQAHPLPPGESNILAEAIQ